LEERDVVMHLDALAQWNRRWRVCPPVEVLVTILLGFTIR
jgi:hypothetical protein